MPLQITRYYLYTKDFNFKLLKNNFPKILCFLRKKPLTLDLSEYPNLKIEENVTEKIFENKTDFDIFSFKKEDLKLETLALTVYIDDLNTLVNQGFKYRRFYILETLLNNFSNCALIYNKGNLEDLKDLKDLKDLEEYKNKFKILDSLDSLDSLDCFNTNMLYIWPNQIEEKNLDYLIKNLNPKNIYYDLSDAWWYFWPNEKEILKKCTLITCSSKYLYNWTCKETKAQCYYVPNGNVLYHIEKSEIPLETKICIYPGNFISKKIDLDLLNKIINNNPDWYFLLFCNEIDYNILRKSINPQFLKKNIFISCKCPQDILMQLIVNCKIGIIPLIKNSEWTAGMLPDKLFNFINAKIPTIYSGGADENFEDYKEVCFKINENNLDLDFYTNLINKEDVYKKYERDWLSMKEDIIKIFNSKN